MPSSLLFCLGGHQVFKSMHPTKSLGCNSWTLPFPIPAGGKGPAGLQSARSRAGPAGQSKGYEVPAGETTRQDKSLGLPAGTRVLGKTRRGLSFMRRGKAVKALTPKARPFLDRQVRGSETVPTERAENVVPCSTQSQFPYLKPAPLHSAHCMPIHRDPGAHEMGVPSRNSDP